MASGFTSGTNNDLVGSIANPLDPTLGPLANNGGLTLTHALLAGSPAIDNGDYSVPGSLCFVVGSALTRVRSQCRSSVDIRAFEFGANHDPTITASISGGGTIASGDHPP